MARFSLKKGDTVLVIAGKDKGKRGVVERALPLTNKVVVAGVNIMKKHVKPSQKNPRGGIIEKSAPMNRSKVMVIDPTTDKPTRVSFVRNAKGEVYRASRSTKQSIEKN